MTEKEIKERISTQEFKINEFEIAILESKWYQYGLRASCRSSIEERKFLIEILEDELKVAPGMEGPLVNLFNHELTQEEWNALCVVHRMGNRLECAIQFKWSKSIDVKHGTTSQIIDQDVFLSKEKNND